MAQPIDRTTVDRLVVEHLPLALRFALRLTGDSYTADDVVQEALCRVLRQWKSYRGESAFSTWLLQIVVNVDRDRRRKRGTLPMPSTELPGDGTTPHEEAVAEETKNKVRITIDELPERQREVAILSLGEGLSSSEVAKILGTTEANVHTCLYLARKKIAQTLGLSVTQNE